MLFKGFLFCAGVATHIGFFNKGEHHLHGIAYLQFFLTAFFTAVFFQAAAVGFSPREAFITASVSFSLYFAGLYSSLVLYRLFFSPLRKFPGPFLPKLGCIGYSISMTNSNTHIKELEFHKKHGHFVRLGPSDLSITHPEAPNAIFGFGTKCTKPDFYDLNLPWISMMSTRKREEHDQRRKIWSGAFTDQRIRDYEQRIAVYQSQLIAKIAESQDHPVNVKELANQFFYDIITDLAFGTSHHMLKSNEFHWVIDLMQKGLAPLGYMLPMWLFRLLLAVPGATGEWMAFKDQYRQMMENRMKVGNSESTTLPCAGLRAMRQTKPNTPNIASFFLEPLKGRTPSEYEWNVLQGDSQLIIVAGSGTTSHALTFLLYELARNPGLKIKLREELTRLATSNGISNQKLASLHLLTGIINETLRLHGPSGVPPYRKTPSEGMTIGGTYIPGNVTVWAPQYVICRDEAVFAEALSFRPERWYSRREMIKEPAAYVPFMIGVYNCVGKPLALMALRTTIAKILLEYDFFFSPGDDGSSVEREAKTQFNTLPGPLRLIFRKLDAKSGRNQKS